MKAGRAKARWCRFHARRLAKCGTATFCCLIRCRICIVGRRRGTETLRNHTLRTGEQLGTATSDQPTTAAAAAITVSVDSTFIRSREEGARHPEVRVGNVETASRGRQVFRAVATAEARLWRRRAAPGYRFGGYFSCRITERRSENALLRGPNDPPGPAATHPRST
jgi:hypothetical protein